MQNCLISTFQQVTGNSKLRQFPNYQNTQFKAHLNSNKMWDFTGVRPPNAVMLRDIRFLHLFGLQAHFRCFFHHVIVGGIVCIFNFSIENGLADSGF